eukprot:SAG31_NODE_4071_length_3616_cov_3.727040_1_plen_47_part_10
MAVGAAAPRSNAGTGRPLLFVAGGLGVHEGGRRGLARAGGGARPRGA